MATLTLDGWWFVAQATLLAAAGLGAAAWRVQRQPRAAARIATVAVGAILASSLLAFVPLPRRGTPDVSAVADATNDAARSPRLTPDDAEYSASRRVPALDLGALLHRVDGAATAINSISHRSSTGGWAPWTLGAISLGACVELTRWGRSWRHVRRLRRSSRPVDDESLQTAAAAATVALRAAGASLPRYEIRESPNLVSPAVLGGAPVIVALPTAWREWSDAPLRAALAHELAHAARGDFAARMLAAAVGALHWYHPLVRWLNSRQTLAQEAAADRLAARALGGQRYLHALSQLAVWFDGQSQLRAEPLHVPQLSNHLIRRIIMLRTARECTGARRRQRGTLAAAAIIALALGATTLRTRADEATASEPPSTPSATADTPALFQREPFDFALIGDNPLGAFVVRVDEIMQQPQLRAVVENEMIPQEEIAALWAQQVSQDAPTPRFDLSQIELVAGIGQLKISARSEQVAGAEHTHQIALGTPEWIIRFKHPVNWQAWVARHLPGAQEKSIDGVAYFELPMIRALGPQPLCVAELDSHTIVVALSDRIAEATRPRPLPAVSDMAQRWRQADGGLATFVATDAEIKADPSLPTDPMAKLASEVTSEIRGVGYAMDFDEATSEAVLRCELAAGDAENALKMRDALSTMLATARATLNTDAAPDDPARADLIASGQVLLGETGDGQPAVLLTGRMKLRSGTTETADRSGPAASSNSSRR